MLDRIIQQFGQLIYSYPTIPEDVPGKGRFGNLKIALLADHFTTVCLAAECRVRSLTPANFREVLTKWKPDLVFVESAFHGAGDAWRYKLAKQPWIIRCGRKRKTLPRLVALARELGIPAIFWNKDDSAFFEPFIEVASLFDYVFTSDNRAIPHYTRRLPSEARVAVLAMAIQPAFHNFTGFAFERNEACFVGSYYRRILNRRRRFQNMIFDACDLAAMPMHIFDRNDNRLSRFFEFRFPPHQQVRLHPHVAYAETAAVYKHYAISLNVNSITNSSTMCSRRLVEILACGGIVLTNPSRVVMEEFRDFCYAVSQPEEARELLTRIRRCGPSREDKERAAAGAAYVARHHTWECRLEQIAATVHL